MRISYALGKARGLARLLANRLLAVPFYVATAIVPRSPRLWAFGSWQGKRFADNPKHFFLHCHARESSDVRAVWLSADRGVVRKLRALGLPAHHRSSPRGIWCALRAGVYLLDVRVADVHHLASRGALRVNLWHGVPLKKIERDIDQAEHTVARAHRGPRLTRAILKFRRPELTERYDAVLATSKVTAERFASAFGVSESAIIRAGYPRNDPLLSADTRRFLLPDERAVVDEMLAHGRAGRRVLLYMPTFRDWGNTADRVIPIDWAAMDALLRQRDGVLYCKLHPNDRASLPDVSHLERIQFLPSGIDPYPLLQHTHALISDYSSIFFDYLMLDRPIVFYAYDLDAYRRYSRSMYDDYDRVTPGARATDPAQLEAVLGELLTGYEKHSLVHEAARAQVRDRFFDHVDAAASARLYDELVRRTA